MAKYTDPQRILSRLAEGDHRIKSSFLESRNSTRLERIREYSMALTSRTTPAPQTTLLTERSAKTPPPPHAALHHQRQAKSMTTEIFCGPCSRDNLTRDASGYCTECSEYFCDVCIKHHKNLKITKNHSVRDRRQMPIIRYYADDTEMIEICVVHTGELVRYFCKDHDESCCGVCATLNHRQCDRLVYIPEIKSKKTSKSCFTTIKQVAALASQFDKAKDEAKQNLKLLDTQKEDFEKSLTKLHRDIMDMILKLAREASEYLNYVYEDEKGYLLARADICDDAIKSLQRSTSHLEMAKKNGIESHVFLQMKKVSKQVLRYEALLADIRNKNNHPMKFVFKADGKIRHFMKSLEHIGTVEFTQKPVRTLTPCAKFNVKSRSDTYEVCDITGSCVMDDGRIVLADMHNESLKVVDSKFNMLTQTKLSAEPWDLCVVNKDQIVVSLPRENKLQFFIISSTIQPLRKIGNVPSTKGSQYYGVVCLFDKLYVTCPKDEIPNIKILDMQGAQLQMICPMLPEQSLFADPLYIAVKYDGCLIYVSDSGNNSIISLEVKHEWKHVTYSIPNNVPPAGICVQSEGDVYFCGLKSNTIQVLTAQGEFRDELVGSEGGLLNPQSISYSSRDRRFIVTMQKSDNVTVFQVS